MANNRIWLRCKQCGECLFLGKHFMGEYYWANYSNEDVHLEDKLNDFFEKHCWCEEPYNKQHDYGETPVGKYTTWDTKYEIAYEFDDNTRCKNCHRDDINTGDLSKALEECYNNFESIKDRYFGKKFVVYSRMMFDKIGNLVGFEMDAEKIEEE